MKAPASVRRFVLPALLLLLSGLIQGCATMAVHPWDRDLMAEPKMRYEPVPMETAVDDHVYFSKEASTGDQTVGGGGCGCN